MIDIIPLQSFFSDLFKLVSTIGTRGSALLDEAEQASVDAENNAKNGTSNASAMSQNLNDVTNTYVQFQKVICGRDISSDDAISGLFGGGAQNQ